MLTMNITVRWALLPIWVHLLCPEHARIRDFRGNLGIIKWETSELPASTLLRLRPGEHEDEVGCGTANMSFLVFKETGDKKAPWWLSDKMSEWSSALPNHSRLDAGKKSSMLQRYRRDGFRSLQHAPSLQQSIVLPLPLVNRPQQ